MTAQIRENLIYESEETSMTFCPPLPAGHPLIRVLDNDEIICDGDNGILHSTACWRGYQGTWEIKNRRFYLVGLRGRLELVGGEPLFADWFTGVLRIPRGEQILYVHMGFGSVYEQEVDLRMRRSVGTAVRTERSVTVNRDCSDSGGMYEGRHRGPLIHSVRR